MRVAQRAFAAPVFSTLLIGGAVVAMTLSAFGFSRPSSRTPELRKAFELTVREERKESIYHAATDSLFTLSFRISLSHYGRIEETLDGETRLFTILTDSLVLVQDAPLHFAARVNRDTIAVTRAGSMRTQTPPLEMEEAMLKCLFEGPALLVTPSEGDRPAQIKDLKTHCAGGLYRRLNLPVTLGAFLSRVPPERDRSGGRWEVVETCPSFTGLGHFPQLKFTYTLPDVGSEPGASSSTVEIACDTTLSNVRTVTPAGEAVDIISNHIRVRGVVRPWNVAPFLYEGELTIQEDIRYVRPALGSPVLHKTCDVEILLAPF